MGCEDAGMQEKESPPRSPSVPPLSPGHAQRAPTTARPACGCLCRAPRPRRSSPRALGRGACTSKQPGGDGALGMEARRVPPPCPCWGAPVPRGYWGCSGVWAGIGAGKMHKPGEDSPRWPSQGFHSTIWPHWGTHASSPAPSLPPCSSSLATLILSSAHSFYLSFCRLHQPVPVW